MLGDTMFTAARHLLPKRRQQLWYSTSHQPNVQFVHLTSHSCKTYTESVAYGGLGCAPMVWVLTG